MTGVEIILLLIGCVFMIGSFFITEKLSPSELSKVAELSEEELGKIIDRGLTNAVSRIDDSIGERLENSMENVDRGLEKETNEKIMAISEYSDTVLEAINKSHNEIMFLYSMLNDKHAELTGMVSDLQRLSADVRNMQESMANQRVPVRPQPTVDRSRTVTRPEQARTRTEHRTAAMTTGAGAGTTAAAGAATVTATATSTTSSGSKVSAASIPSAASVNVAPKADAASQENGSNPNHKREILALHKQGLNEIEIAKRLKMGIGEVRLMIGLYKGEENS